MAKQKLKKIPGLDPIEVKKKERARNIKKAQKIKKDKIRKEKRDDVIEKIQHLNYKKIAVIGIIIFLSLLVFLKLANTKIKNIEVNGNNILSEQEIIDLAGIRNYPNSFAHSSHNIKKKLEKNIYIDHVKVKKSNLLKKVTITVYENRPLYFYGPENQTILSDGKHVLDTFNVPVLVNQVPEDILKKFTTKLNNINDEVLIRINEIRYTPNEVDDTLFIFSMNDGNYIYINTYNLNKLNDYLSMLKTFNNKKGILHLDSGDYFEIVDTQINPDDYLNSEEVNEDLDE
ncbi:MAG: FtsQ-type POTRA domain-containing protein [Bacilli bacterium]|nr:FtsQ-type POTRA domain-containing protein [Bacilli bacterium]